MRKIGLRGVAFSALATSFTAATASNFVLRFDQRNVVFAFKERKNGLDLQIVGDDLLPDLQGQVDLVEGEGKTSARRTRRILTTRKPLVSATWRATVALAMTISLLITRGHWLTAKEVHIFYKSAQLFKVLRDLWRSGDCALAPRISTRPRLTRF
jgi:hypothetical protein